MLAMVVNVDTDGDVVQVKSRQEIKIARVSLGRLQ